MGQPTDDFLSRLLQTLAESLDVREIFARMRMQGPAAGLAFRF